MVNSTWLKMKVFEPENEHEIHNLKIGEYFMMGNRMNQQKELKEIGQQISFYKVVNKKDNRIEYTTVFDVLKEG